MPITVKPDCGLARQFAVVPVQRSTKKPVSSCGVPLFELTRQLTVTLELEIPERLKLSGAFGTAVSGSGMRLVDTIRSSYQTLPLLFHVDPVS